MLHLKQTNKKQAVGIQSGISLSFHFLGSNISLLTQPVFPSTISRRVGLIHKISRLKKKKFPPVPPPRFTDIYKHAAV